VQYKYDTYFRRRTVPTQCSDRPKRQADDCQQPRTTQHIVANAYTSINQSLIIYSQTGLEMGANFQEILWNRLVSVRWLWSVFGVLHNEYHSFSDILFHSRLPNANRISWTQP